MRPVHILIVGALCGLAPGLASAMGDIYVGKDAFGNVFFTDTPPTLKGFTVFIDVPSRSGSTWAEYKANFSTYDPLIVEHSARHGVDASLVKAVIFAESAFNPRAVSRMGAEGLMQLMPQTQRTLGVLDSFDPDENIGGGSRFLAQLLERYDGDKTRAVAAYNAGPGAVDKYGGVPPFPETRAYVDKVLAMEAHFRAQGLTAWP